MQKRLNVATANLGKYVFIHFQFQFLFGILESIIGAFLMKIEILAQTSHYIRYQFKTVENINVFVLNANVMKY